MNANWLPQMPAIKNWLTNSVAKLNDVGITTSQLDSEVILATCLNKNRTYLHAHPELEIGNNYIQRADKMIKLRITRLPIAYITGYKEFYGRQFKVTKDTLIPRPESETIIEILKNIVVINITDNALKLIDIGTGSGCLGVTAKLEFPSLDVTLTDISPNALRIASLNAIELKASVTTLQNDLLTDYKGNADIIIANLPYVDKTWERSPETDYEPALALFAENSGKELIEKLIDQSTEILPKCGYLIIEADPIQHNGLIQFANKKSFILLTQQDCIIAFKYSC